MKAIAIDGPAGAGKTTQAKILAKKLGYLYVDTGAMYRTVALAHIRANEPPIEELLKTIDMTVARNDDGQQLMFLNGEDVTGLLRTQEVSAKASALSALPVVREFLMDFQRGVAQQQDVVMEGRDIGTVILPGADVKIYLTADLLVRAYRRKKELGEAVDSVKLVQEIAERDHNDSTRPVSPLRMAEDAHLVDCSETSIQETTAKILEYVYD